jgi:hypothetical protein
MKALKTTLSVLTLILFAGCATLTDANVDLAEEETTVISIERANDTWDSRNGEDMGTVVEKPVLGE